MIKWSRVRLYLSILSCEGLFATGMERLQFSENPTDEQAAAIQKVKQWRDAPLYDYAGAMHVHSTYSDGAGTVEDVAAAANEAGLDFVLLCDHSNLDAITNGDDGWRGKTLVLVGTEVTTDTGHLLALDVPPSFLPVTLEAHQTQREIMGQGGISLIALPCDLKDHWRDFDKRVQGTGLEVFNLSAIARTKINLPGLAMIWRRYNGPERDKAFHLVSARPAREIACWDSQIQPKSGERRYQPVVGIASLDAHAVMKFAGKTYPFPTYAEIFRTLRTHVITESPMSPKDDTAKSKALVHDAIRRGRCYMSYDNYGDASGFRYYASESLDAPVSSALMGDEIETGEGKVLICRAPHNRSIIRLFRDGELVRTILSGTLVHSAAQPGSYRVEVYTYKYRFGQFCAGVKPWIFSNPIYVQPESA
ncbi:MAG: hypothetical protein JWQ02_4116 [Capsulimonas sp.]|nr:hypothetical protein [Capsulimonas sp.]